MSLTDNDIPAEVRQARQRFGIVGNAPALIRAIGRALRVAPIDLSVLVTGESGSGKEFFPKIIHNYSPRKHARYIAVNCGAIPEGTIDSELFGHEKGAFTGAVATRKGYFEEADGGTIFLDEVAELPLTTQARLLRVLESGEFIKVGSSQVQRTNIRVVAATNVDMLAAVAEGRFREDLYYRLSTVQIAVPPLRDRGADIMLLARKFAGDFSERYRMPAITFDDEARSSMLHYGWPGNVRQLKNVVEQLALFHAGETLSRQQLQPYLPGNVNVYTPAVIGRDSAGAGSGAYEREREMLFNMIFNMQREIDRLREAIDRHTDNERATSHDLCLSMPGDSDLHETPHMSHSIVKMSDWQDITGTTAVNTAQPKSLEDTEREAIQRTLEKNGGRRKATAQELNISERTLYRKIKEFGLE